MNFNWNFDKLPKSEHKTTVDAFHRRDVDALVMIHNKYKLSINEYCCNPDESILRWYGDAIQKGKIKPGS